MASLFSICFILCALFNGRAQCAQWSSTSLPDGYKLYKCLFDNVTLEWQFELTSEEVLGDIEWLYNGQSQELVAMSTRGTFLPTPTFSHRVSRVDNAGLSLYRAQTSDSGNYSVEVNVYGQGGALHTVLRRTAVLYVYDHLMTTDSNVHVTQLYDPVYDSVSRQWVLQLQCGNFIFKDHPPFQVEWETPIGALLYSTSFSNGYFYLSVPTPIRNGSYTCRVPHHAVARSCFRGMSSRSLQDSVTIDSVEARLLLLEKENSDLKYKLAKIEDAEHHQVAFHAAGIFNRTVGLWNPLKFVNVYCNEGNAYDPSSGYFTAPYSGLYFFIAKTSSGETSGGQYHNLMVDDRLIDSAYTKNPTGEGLTAQSPVHGTIHLTQGQRVYVVLGAYYGSRYEVSHICAFTGFMLSRDQ